jgi:hypothetical protein
MRETLRQLDIKITELAEYLHISRPTMYKFIESYEKGARSLIPKPILGLLDYIEKTPYIGKKNVVNYILTNIAVLDDNIETSDAKTFKKLAKGWSEASPERRSLILHMLEVPEYENEIRFFIEIQPLLKKRELTNDEQGKIDLYKKIIRQISEINSKGGKTHD